MSNTNQNAVATKELSHSERFMNKVITEFGSNVGTVALTDFQKRLAQNYFIALDNVLKSTEEKRLKKSGKYQDKTPVVWANVNMDKLARDVVSMARVGFDPAQKNHINLIPFKNNTTSKYDIGFIEGYRGIELKATKYGLEVPDHVIVEVVYKTDHFKSIKKDIHNKIEHYEFHATNDFDRGEIIGGFYYHIYMDKPEKNKLVVMSLKDIKKRKPAYASVEFWGGEKDIWKDGKKTGNKEQVEGWYEKMVEKTIRRAAYGDITIDSQKIDDDYMRLKQLESDFTEAEVDAEINANANGERIDVTPPPDTEEPPADEPDKPSANSEHKDGRSDAGENMSPQDQFEMEFGNEKKGPDF